ncbi:hypothetical protein KBX10_08950 [Corynebacterium sp. CCUG 59401]|nr:hypothetical protein [Corynebacterium pseudogenitalium]
MKRGAAAIAVAAAAALAGCSAPTHPLAGTTWEIVAVYTDPDFPGDVPLDAAGRAVIVFGRESLTARTGCAPLQAGASISDSDVQLRGVTTGKLDSDCAGGSRRLHTQLSEILVPDAEFDLRRYGEDEITLTARRGDEIDLNPPTIRLVAQ